jgi:hypothetical protein
LVESEEFLVRVLMVGYAGACDPGECCALRIENRGGLREEKKDLQSGLVVEIGVVLGAEDGVCGRKEGGASLKYIVEGVPGRDAVEEFQLGLDVVHDGAALDDLGGFDELRESFEDGVGVGDPVSNVCGRVVVLI